MPKFRDIARPTSVEGLSEESVYAAVKAFVCEFARPELDADLVFQGWQNVPALPAASEEYAVISILSDAQHGTDLESWGVDEETEEGAFELKALVEPVVQVDFCSNSDLARLRARRLAIAARSSFAVGHFRQWGMSSLYADDVRDLSFIGDGRRFVRRYMTTLHLALWEGSRIGFEYFERIEPRIENVDVHHPANRGE